jgi:hypothetical protein
MSDAVKSAGRSYDNFYREFNSPMSHRLRQEAYGTDIGQHSWVTAEELEANISRLELTGASRVLQRHPLANGNGAFRSVSWNVMRSSIRSDAARARPAAIAWALTSARLPWRPTRLRRNVNGPPGPQPRSDVILHLRDRQSVFQCFSVSGGGTSPDSCGKVLVHRCGSHYGVDFPCGIRLRAVHG